VRSAQNRIKKSKFVVFYVRREKVIFFPIAMFNNVVYTEKWTLYLYRVRVEQEL